MSATDQRKALIRVLDAWKRVQANARSAASGEPLPNEPPIETPAPTPPRSR